MIPSSFLVFDFDVPVDILVVIDPPHFFAAFEETINPASTN
jgi:hypothetical protein